MSALTARIVNEAASQILMEHDAVVSNKRERQAGFRLLPELYKRLEDFENNYKNKKSFQAMIRDYMQNRTYYNYTRNLKNGKRKQKSDSWRIENYHVGKTTTDYSKIYVGVSRGRYLLIDSMRAYRELIS